LEEEEVNDADHFVFDKVFATAYNVELLFEQKPVFTIRRISDALKKQLGSVNVIEEEDITSFFSQIRRRVAYGIFRFYGEIHFFP
jgi:transposase